MKIGVVAIGERAETVVLHIKKMGLNFYFQVLKKKSDYISDGIFDSDMVFVIAADDYKKYRSEVKRLSSCQFCVSFAIGDDKAIEKDLHASCFFHIEDKPDVEKMIARVIFHLSVGLLCAKSSLLSIDFEELKQVLKRENTLQCEKVGNVEDRTDHLSALLRSSKWYKNKKKPMEVFASFVGGSITLNDIASVCDTILEKSGKVPYLSVSLAIPKNEEYLDEYSLVIIASYDKNTNKGKDKEKWTF